MVAQENLKILRQFTKLLQQACHERDQPFAHAQPLANTPAACAGSLQWFAHLAQPCRGLDGAASARIGQLIRLHAAVCKPDPAATPQEQAYELARSLPHYDRDLTAFYLLPDHLPRMEYELDVAHSILRLHAPATLDSLRQRLPAWRSQGLLHVLAVAASNMPEPSDWIPDKDTAADSLGCCLETLLRSPREYTHAIESFIATQDLAGSPTAQAIAATLDRLAVLMDVKSDAEDEAGHDLGAALAAFPKLDALAPGDAWWSIRPALERALPPSVLRLNPAWSSKRARTAFKGSWYASVRPGALARYLVLGLCLLPARYLVLGPCLLPARYLVLGPCLLPALDLRPAPCLLPARYLVLGPCFLPALDLRLALAHPVLLLSSLEAVPVRPHALPEHGFELLRQVVRGPVRLVVDLQQPAHVVHGQREHLRVLLGARHARHLQQLPDRLGLVHHLVHVRLNLRVHVHNVFVVVPLQRVARVVIVERAHHDSVQHELALARVAAEYLGQHLLAIVGLVEKYFHQQPLLLAQRQAWQALQRSHAEWLIPQHGSPQFFEFYPESGVFCGLKAAPLVRYVRWRYPCTSPLLILLTPAKITDRLTAISRLRAQYSPYFCV